ncbi:MAG: fumarylacetoacetate hydrolase family protein [Tissierellia bacterium]|nr:fumarylacetoacetate hydrolase family protein [Tissierellia bacterium]
MKLVSYTNIERQGYGILDGEYIIPLKEEDGFPKDLLSAISQGLEMDDLKELMGRHEGRLALKLVRIDAPFTRVNRNVICLGMNYKEHVEEMAAGMKRTGDLPKFPVYFTKMVDNFSGPDSCLNISDSPSEKVDYEVELAVIIGKDGKNISKEDAYDHIFGYTIANDFSARDLQTNHMQWFKGKSLDGFCGLGPVLVTKDEFPIEKNPSLSSYVNGDLRQSSSLDKLIFDIPTIIEDFSRGISLRAGDIILTGTPSGVGMGMKPPVFLKAGDVVTCKIDGIGELTHKMV